MRDSSRLLAVLAVLLGSLTACGGDGTTYDRELAHYGFEKAHIARLPDGRRLAVGSRTGHDVTVQWGDGDDWTAPETVLTVPRLWTHDLTLREHEGTAGISADFWDRKKLDDDYAPVRTKVVVCRDHSCTTGPQPESLSGADVAEDGSLISYGISRRRVVFWEDGRFRTDQISGLPTADAIRTTPTGAFLAISAREEAGLCHQDLYAAPRGSVAFSLAARDPGRRASGDCSAYAPDLDPEHPDRVSLYVDDAVDRLEFVRKDGTWSAVTPAVTPIAYRNTDGRSTIAVTQVHGSVEMLVGSPDLRRIVVQSRPAGAKAWSRPKTVAHAPAGTLCRAITGETADSGAGLALVSCYPAAQAWHPAGTESASVGLVLAADTTGHWRVATLESPSGTIGHGSSYVLAQGAHASLVWREGADGFAVLPLPADPVWDQVSLLDDGRALLLAGNPDQQATCRPGWAIAAQGARSWPALHRLPRKVQRELEKGRCSFQAWGARGHYEGGVYGGVFQADFAFEVDGDNVRVKTYE